VRVAKAVWKVPMPQSKCSCWVPGSASEGCCQGGTNLFVRVTRILITPMCKVKSARCRGIRLESKPISYSWFPSQLGPQVSNPGYSIRADILANVVAGKAHTVINRHTLNRFFADFLSKPPVSRRMSVYRAAFVACVIAGCGQ
jgi:hypothetical protein